jgi:hypothetical protein
MSLKFAEGFGINRGSVQLGRKWATASGSLSAAVAGYKDVGIAIASTNATLKTPAFTDQAQWTFGAAIWWATRTASVGSKITLLRGGAEQCSFHFDFSEDGNIFNILVKRGSTLLDTVGPFFTREPAYYEFQVTAHTTTGAWEIKREGVSVGSDTGVNTADTGSNNADQIEIVFDSAGATMRFGDFVLMDDQGGAMDDFIGPMKVLAIRPEGDSACAWTPSTGVDNYALVDDVPGTPEDSNRVSSYTPTEEDIYTYEDLSIPSGVTLKGVILESVSAMESSGTRTIRAVYENAATAQSNGSNEAKTTTVWGWHSQVWEQEPILASAWTVALVNAAKFGIEVVS